MESSEKHRVAKVGECPFTGKPICLLPALILDVGLIHVHRADKVGNAQTEEAAQAYFQKYIFDIPHHQAYLDLIGRERLENLRHSGRAD